MNKILILEGGLFILPRGLHVLKRSVNIIAVKPYLH